MDLSLTEEQGTSPKGHPGTLFSGSFPKETLIELEDTHRDITPELWARARDMGWLGMLIPVEYGGSGNSFTDAAVVFEELGRGPVDRAFPIVRGPSRSNYRRGRNERTEERDSPQDRCRRLCR